MEKDLASRFSQLKERYGKASEGLIRAKERLESEKDSRGELVKKIKKRGFDPGKLRETYEEKETGIIGRMASMEKSVDETEEKLRAISV